MRFLAAIAATIRTALLMAISVAYEVLVIPLRVFEVFFVPRSSIQSPPPPSDIPVRLKELQAALIAGADGKHTSPKRTPAANPKLDPVKTALAYVRGQQADLSVLRPHQTGWLVSLTDNESRRLANGGPALCERVLRGERVAGFPLCRPPRMMPTQPVPQALEPKLAFAP